ncbi:MAG: Gfo/Idh/MocA family oxidoreductase, partial [Pirellulales bacterium]|nr:Gfo/Idh/MocA family oxidoreductase [Pirellulales bacterium]
MRKNMYNHTSRREFLRSTGKIAAASALAGIVPPHVHAAENNIIQVALVGCGGRGTGAVSNALSNSSGPIKLVAMADVFENRLKNSCHQLKKQFGDKIDVPQEHKFVGFDGYQQAMDCLKENDVVIMATPPAFRWVHFGYAIKKGINVFMEKPISVDGPSARKMFALAEESVKRNLKVGVGLMWRHCPARRELNECIGSGQIGDIHMMRAYRMHGPIASFRSDPKPEGISELLYQIKRFHSFLWASGGCFSDYNIHSIDECCWMKGAWPIQAQSSGGRNYRGNSVDQNFDNYSVEYTFADGAKLFFYGRCIMGCLEAFDSYAHGTKGLASITNTRIFKGQNPTKADTVWKNSRSGDWGYGIEWKDLINAIRQDKPYNEAARGNQASLVTSMGRMAAHTGQLVTYDQ